MKTNSSRLLDRCWVFFLPVYFLAAAALDSTETTNGEYLKFVLAMRHTAPEYWNHGRFPAGKDDDPVVLVNFHDAAAYCRFVGKRLPTVDEWKSTCEGGKLKEARRYLGMDFDRRRYGRAKLQSALWPSEYMRLLAPLSAGMEERSERISLRAGRDAGDVAAGFVAGRSGFVKWRSSERRTG